MATPKRPHRPADRSLPALGVAAGLLLLAATASAACPALPGDVNGDGVVSITDVQCMILTSLAGLGGGAPPPCLVPDEGDLNCDDVINIADVQLTIGYALGIPLSPALDANADGCVDACESGGGAQIQQLRVVPAGHPALQSPSFRVEDAELNWRPRQRLESPQHRIELD